MRKSKADNAEYMKQYRARQKGPEAEGKLLGARDPQILLQFWKLGRSKLKTPIHVKLERAASGLAFKGEFPGAVPHAMHILTDGRHTKALSDKRLTLQGLMYEMLFVAFLGNSPMTEKLRMRKLIPDRLARGRSDQTVEEARGIAKAISQQATDKKQEAWGSFEGTKEDIAEYYKDLPTQDEYLSWAELKAKEFVYGERKPDGIYDKKDD